jgi:hypothetical protein
MESEEDFWKDAVVIDAREPKDELGYKDVCCDGCSAPLGDDGVAIAKCHWIFRNRVECDNCYKRFFSKVTPDKTYEEGDDFTKEEWY